MIDYKKSFIEFAIRQNVLKFGQFTLKSGRISPYFFNAGEFKSGMALACLGRFYANALQHSPLQYDLLFGPAYKGIPLAAATAIALADHHQLDIPYVFNRKETKNHGEGGQLVGAKLAGNVLIIDDVITAGTAIRESIQLIGHEGANTAGVIIALDRQEKGPYQHSAIQQVQDDFDIPVISIINLAEIIDYLKVQNDPNIKTHQNAVIAYQQEYGV